MPSRDCSNYPGLETGGWFRAGVRTPEEHELLERALRVELDKHAPAILRRPPKPALMIQGTCSDAGKSVLTAALCRIFHQDGFSVAPFKAQNMALNSGVTALGEEMGRAQMVQAQACRIDPDARMNPILLKPHSNTGSQVIVMGKAVGHMEAGNTSRPSAGSGRTSAPPTTPSRTNTTWSAWKGPEVRGNQPEIRGRGQHEHGPLRPR